MKNVFDDLSPGRDPGMVRTNANSTTSMSELILQGVEGAYIRNTEGPWILEWASFAAH